MVAQIMSSSFFHLSLFWFSWNLYILLCLFLISIYLFSVFFILSWTLVHLFIFSIIGLTLLLRIFNFIFLSLMIAFLLNLFPLIWISWWNLLLILLSWFVFSYTADIGDLLSFLFMVAFFRFQFSCFGSIWGLSFLRFQWVFRFNHSLLAITQLLRATIGHFFISTFVSTLIMLCLFLLTWSAQSFFRLFF